MLFLEFLIIYFICIDTPIYDQPFGYQGTVLVIPLLRFYLFLWHPQQEGSQDLCQGGGQWDGLIPSLPPCLMARFHGHLLHLTLEHHSGLQGQPSYPTPSPSLPQLLLKSSPGSLAPEEEAGAHTWECAPSFAAGALARCPKAVLLWDFSLGLCSPPPTTSLRIQVLQDCLKPSSLGISSLCCSCSKADTHWLFSKCCLPTA